MSSLQPGRFISGTSGLVFEERNKNSFPPTFHNKSRLHYYASLFNSIEINSSFYKKHQYKTYKRWSEETGPSFKFTVKIWQGITHIDKFQDKDLADFMLAISGIGEKKGCILIQYPATSKVILPEIERLIKNIHKLDPDWRIAVEIRNFSWLTTDFFSILRNDDVALVAHDRKKVVMLEANAMSSFIYLRFHGPNGDYRESYPLEFLQAYAQKIKESMMKGLDVYTYFNNTIGDAVQNLKAINGLVNCLK